jgi:hypothetical protein
MSDDNSRPSRLLRVARVWVVAAWVFLALAVAVTVAMAVANLRASPSWTAAVPLAVALAGELAAAVWVAVIYGIIQVLLSGQYYLGQTTGRLGRIEGMLEELSASTKTLNELARLSDRAKRLVCQEQEIEALRETVRRELTLQDYEAADAMIDAIEKELGYTEEAARMRDEAVAVRRTTMEEKVDVSVKRIQGIIDRRDWARASREAQRLIKIMPQSERIAALPQRIDTAKAQHKRELLQAYGEAVRRNDVDRSIDLLKQLDIYLTSQEAAALQESARGVFRARLHNLGVQFAICVTDQRWAEAVATGEQIILEYPNSRMATEVRSKMEQLRARATGAVSAAK